MDQSPPNLPPEQRALRRQIAIALLLSPTLCVLPILAFVAPSGTIRTIIFAVWFIISLTLAIVIWRAANKLRQLVAQQESSSD